MKEFPQMFCEDCILLLAPVIVNTRTIKQFTHAFKHLTNNTPLKVDGYMLRGRCLWKSNLYLNTSCLQYTSFRINPKRFWGSCGLLFILSAPNFIGTIQKLCYTTPKNCIKFGWVIWESINKTHDHTVHPLL